MPGNGFTFPVRVSREVQGIGLFQCLDDCVNVLFVALDDLVLHRKLIIGVNGTFFGDQVADMPVRRQDVEVLAKVLADGAGLRRRFHNYEIFRHIF